MEWRERIVFHTTIKYLKINDPQKPRAKKKKIESRKEKEMQNKMDDEQWEGWIQNVWHKIPSLYIFHEGFNYKLWIMKKQKKKQRKPFSLFLKRIGKNIDLNLYWHNQSLNFSFEQKKKKNPLEKNRIPLF